jgi:outer membrane protein OmpA-like peptidoglycan-associated protein
MATKKYALLLAFIAFLQLAGTAQTSYTANHPVTFNWKDSSKVPTKSIPQYNEFLQNKYPYPAKQRSQLELGGSVGLGFIIGDRPLGTKNSFGGAYTGGIAGGISVRKALGHIFSLRAGYYGSMISVPSYKTEPGVKNLTHMLSIDGIFSLNTPSYYRGNPKWNIYVLGGYSVVATQNIGYVGPYPGVYLPQGGTFASSKSYPDKPNWVYMHALNAGGGVAYKLNDKWNIGIEQRFTLPMFGYDYLDGYKAGVYGDFYSYSMARINMNIGSTAKKVQPLWWINPNNYVYNELNSPQHMKIPTPKLPDGDGDGIIDQFDLEPNTPAGASVDSHGRALDTDGDGVPDFKDKEKLTPATWFPVNSDGVGNAPEPACCKEVKELREMLTNGGTWKGGKKVDCAIGDLPSIQFKANSATLSTEAKALLDAVGTKIQANADCKVKVIGHPTVSNKKSQQLAYDRVSAVIKYLVEKQGISEGRLIFAYDGGSGDANTIDLQGTTEDGPNTVAPPHPNLKTKN